MKSTGDFFCSNVAARTLSGGIDRLGTSARYVGVCSSLSDSFLDWGKPRNNECIPHVDKVTVVQMYLDVSEDKLRGK